MQQIKNVIRLLLGDNYFNKLKLYKNFIIYFMPLIKNFYIDLLLYYKHSNIFKKDTFNKIEALIIIQYHALEKGFLHNPIRYKFGRQHVIELIKMLKRKDIITNRHRSQIISSYLALCSYYELHSENNIDISDYFDRKDYDLFKKYSLSNIASVKRQKTSTYFENTDKDFYLFSNSRCSVRNFTGEKVPFNTIKDVIDLAKNAPSVCNRQSVKIYYIEDKKIIDSIFEIQGGMKGYADEISQLLIVVSDRNYFYSIGERNQLYIDGGIFLMNILYALHYYKIAACPAHWGLNIDSDIKIKKLINIPASEKVICLVAIGIPEDEFKTTLSLRRSNDEILKKVP